MLGALLREGSTIKAGQRIGLSQPAVSAALGRLRQSLGDELFVRQNGRLAPTDFARGLSLPLRQELDRLEAVLTSPSGFDPAATTGVFRITGSDFFAELLMPRLARLLRARAPGLRVQLVDLVPSDYVERLEQYHADLALIPQTEFSDWLDHSPMFRSSFVAIAQAGNPAVAAAGVADGEEMPIDLFCSLGHVLFSPEGRQKSLGDDALARLGRTREVMMTLPVFSGVCRAVAESDLIALVPRQLAALFAPELHLTLHPVPIPMPVPVIVAVWHKRASANPMHRYMRRIVGEVLRPLNAGKASLPS